MGPGRRLIVTKAIFLSILFYMFGCGKCKSQDEKETYHVVENYVDENCNLYKMVFTEGQYVFRMALAGKCSLLTRETYVKDYKMFLDDNIKQLDFAHKDFLRFEYYESLQMNKETIDDIARITQSKINRKVTLVKSWKEGFEFKIE